MLLHSSDIPSRRTVGVWSVGLRRAASPRVRDAAAELDALGFDAIWIPGSSGGEVFDRADEILAATANAVVATGVVNIWMHSVDEVARRTTELSEQHGGRFLLGLGCSHASLVARAGMTYETPVGKMRRFLDDLDADGRVGDSARVLAALGMLSSRGATRKSSEGVCRSTSTPAQTTSV